MKSLLIFILSLTSSTVLAHSGHLSNESVHGFLHIEHIIVLATFGLIALITKVLRNK
ncbi:MAG: hypothetical protein KAJ92_03690 [Gammaproteobacteria bacterium]|nr:hypothetical protein [Gammaproteobacteria bacterium]MCK5262758.1 hypothetical protein [Gammaproteobacteria bacterium]